MKTKLRDEPFIVYSGDLLSDFDLLPLVEEHVRQENDVTWHCGKPDWRPESPFNRIASSTLEQRYGHKGEYDFANVSVWNPTIFERIPPGNVSFVPVVSDWIGHGGRIGGVIVQDGRWFNIGSRTEYLEVHRTIGLEKWNPRYLQ